MFRTLRQFVTSCWEVIKRVGPFMLGTAFLSSLVDDFLNQHIQEALDSPQSQHGASKWAYFFLALSILSAMIFPLIQTLFVLCGKLEKRSGWKQLECLRKNFQQNLIEQVRAFGQVMMGVLLFFIPGLWKFIHIQMVPLVVTLDPEYQSGKRDAVLESQRIIRRRFWPVLGAEILFFIVYPILGGHFVEIKKLDQHPILFILLLFLDVGVSLVFTEFLFLIWTQEKNREIATEIRTEAETETESECAERQEKEKVLEGGGHGVKEPSI